MSVTEINMGNKDGEHTRDNCQTLCRLCNLIKSDRSMSSFINEIKGIGRAP